MLTVLEVIRRTGDFFAGKGIEAPRLNAELVIGHALGLPRMKLYLNFERVLTEAELEAIRALVRRRAQREPLQYVLGEVEFHGLKLKVDRRSLIPRPETERLVEILIGRFAEEGRRPSSVLDLGTGAGAIALALAKAWEGTPVLAIDLSAEALGLARENAEILGLGKGVRFLESDWFSMVGAGERFDLIVANPPYLSERELAASAPEVRDFEPKAALVSADGGAFAARTILAAAGGFLSPAGWVALETGSGQHEALRKAAEETGWGRTESLQDLAGRDRYFLAWRK